jgi:hypothetical protein
MTRYLLAIATILAMVAAKHATATDTAMIVCRPGEKCFIKYVFDVSTACDLDKWSVGNIQPKGTRLFCRPVRDTKEVRR